MPIHTKAPRTDMGVSKIEEIVKEFDVFLDKFTGKHDKDSWLKQTLYADTVQLRKDLIVKEFRQALTEAHQAGIDEAVERQRLGQVKDVKDQVRRKEAHGKAMFKKGFDDGYSEGIDKAVEKVMPFLKAYKQSLDSDWEVNPVQATPLVYRSPESVLRDKADAIEAKRKMVKDLDDTIKALQKKT